MHLDTTTQNLIVQAKLGNQEALNKLFVLHQSRILRIVRHQLNKNQRSILKLQSMDIVQEVFMYAFQNLEKFEPQSKGHFLNWLGKKVKHHILDRLDYMSRQKRKAQGGEISIDQDLLQSADKSHVQLQLEGNCPTPSQFAVNKEKEEMIDSLLDLLRPDEKQVIIHRDLEEMTFPEIGEVLGKSEEAVRKQYCRAFKKLISLSEEKLKPVMAEKTYRRFENGI